MRFRQIISILLEASSCALLFGCSGGAAKTVKADELRYTVLQEDVPLTLKLSPSDYRCNLVFTAPEDVEYTFWDESDQYAFLRFYTDPEQLAEGDRTEIPTDDYYTVTDANFSVVRTMEQGESVYFTLSVRTTENEGSFFIEEMENAD